MACTVEKIAKCCNDPLQIRETARLRYTLYRDKQLRSRQRPNYHHLLSRYSPQQHDSLYFNTLLLMLLSSQLGSVLEIHATASSLICG